MYSFIKAHKKHLIYIPLIIYWMILLVLTSLPSGMAITTEVSDKINHFGAYGLLSVFLYSAIHFQDKFLILKKNPATFTVLIASIYGLMDEIHQMYIPGRSAEFLDWLADFLGSVTAVLITRFILRKIQEYENEKNKLNEGTFKN